MGVLELPDSIPTYVVTICMARNMANEKMTILFSVMV
jgi:hypothetical protein